MKPLFSLQLVAMVFEKKLLFSLQLVAMVFEKKLPSLSGTSQKLIFNILESIVNEGKSLVGKCVRMPITCSNTDIVKDKIIHCIW